MLFPSGSGTVDISERFESAGAARTMWPDVYDPAAIADAVRTLLADAAYRDAARSLGLAFARYDGPELCARAVLDLHAAREPQEARSS